MNDEVIINTKNEALELIADIANDYDNCKTIEQFKALVQTWRKTHPTCIQISARIRLSLW